MLYTIDTDQPVVIKWGAKGDERILQNVINLVNTFAYEIAYARTIGISRDFTDLPSPNSAAVAANSIRNLISLREPRATLEKVEYRGITEKGNILMQVVVNI